MRNIILSLIAVFLVGCGERFDTTSEISTRTSYNNVLKKLKGEEQEAFIRQFALYTKPYEKTDCGIMNEPCTTRNGMDSLQGLSYEDVIAKVSEHEAHIQELAYRADLHELVQLHQEWQKVQRIPQESIKIFTVDLVPYTQWQGWRWTHWKLTNPTDHKIKGFTVHVKIESSVTGETIVNRYDKTYKGILPAETGSGYLFDLSVEKYLNDKYVITKYLSDISFDGNKPMFVTMSYERSARYEALKSKYAKELKNITETASRMDNMKSYDAPSAEMEQPMDAFERLMRLYPQCKMPNAYLDQKLNEPSHSFFSENNLSPYKVKDGFAYYHLNTSYLDIPVVEIMIPASTWNVRSVTFDLPLSDARARLKSRLGLDFKASDNSLNGKVPELIAAPKNPKQSILVCTSPY